MKRIILIAIVAMIAFTVNAQEKSRSHSKWKEKKNGITYEMEIEMTGTNTKNVEKPHVLFTTKGDAKELKEISIQKSGNFSLTVPTVEGARNINIEPGKYTVKLNHTKLGEQVFEVELKKGDDRQITLTLK